MPAGRDGQPRPAGSASSTPQTTYFPEKDGWAEFEVDADADPLAEQDIRSRQAEIDAKLKEIQKELTRGVGARTCSDAERRQKPLNGDGPGAARRRSARTSPRRPASWTTWLATSAVTPELARLAEALRGLSDRELRDAETALARPRTRRGRRADRAASEGRRTPSIDALQQGGRVASRRTSRSPRTGSTSASSKTWPSEQQDLADKAKTADPKDAAELAKKQKELEDELNKLKEQSDAIKKAADAAKAEEASKLADEAKQIADEMRDLERGDQARPRRTPPRNGSPS